MNSAVQKIHTQKYSDYPMAGYFPGSFGADLLGREEVEVAYRRILSRHTSISKLLKAEYEATNDRFNYRHALFHLQDVERSLKLGNTGVYADADDRVISDYSEAKARNMERDFTAMVKRFSGAALPTIGPVRPESLPGGLAVGVEWARAQVQAAGLEYPIKNRDEGEKEKELSAMARVCCPRWWRRNLRKNAARTLEQFLRLRGQVCHQKGAYVSRQGLIRRASQKRRNSQLLSSLEAVCEETGEVVNLADAVAASVSNPELRRTELMTRVSGYEKIADSLQMKGVFLTLTCPSKYHPVLYTGHANDKYNGTTPREAQGYLAGVWATVRGKWHKAGIRVFGFRVAEPHHDGTPHWHLLLFFCADQWEQAATIFRAEALAVDGAEPGAQKQRFDLKVIDKNKGTAAGYIAKYIAKNIDGFKVGDDHEAQAPADESAARVDAWAGIWGIRQFQQIGSTSVTIWRELRRVRETLAEAEPELLRKIHAAADSGDWAAFVELMGGALVTRDGQTLRAMMVKRDKESRYFEITERIKGVVMRGVSQLATKMAPELHTRTKIWAIRPASAERERTTGPP